MSAPTRYLENEKTGPAPLPRVLREAGNHTRKLPPLAGSMMPAHHTTPTTVDASTNSQPTLAEWIYTLAGTVASVLILFYAWVWSL